MFYIIFFALAKLVYDLTYPNIGNIGKIIYEFSPTFTIYTIFVLFI